MRNSIIKNVLLALLFCGMSSALFSQNVAINNSANTAYISAILDLSNKNTVGTVGVLPPYVTLTALGTFGLSGTAAQSNGIIVYNTGGSVASGLYYWNNSIPSWMPMTGGSLSGGTPNYLARWTSPTSLGIGVAQDNGTGVSMSSTALTPVNKLDVNGSEAVGTYAGTAAPANGMIISGQVGIGNSSPAGSAIIDFTNTKATGGTGAPLLWCRNPNPSANITLPIPVLGEEIYNSTTHCFNFYNGTQWLIESCPCSTAPAVPTITASCSQSFQSSSITYKSSITTGVTYNWSATSTNGAVLLSTNGLDSIIATWPGTGAGTGTLGLTLTNSCGISTASQVVTINVNPTLSGSSTLSVNTAGNIYTCSQAGATYSWSSSNTYGTIVGSTTNQTVSVTSASAIGTFTLSCTVSFGVCSQTITYPVTIACPATPTISGATALVISTSGNIYTCSLSGASYSWSSSSTNGSIVGSTTNQSISVTAGGSAGTFTLTCAVTDGPCTYTVTLGVSVFTSCGHGNTLFSYSASVQTWNVPACITTITLVAKGAPGGACDGNNGGKGAIDTAVVTVLGGHTLDIVTGQTGQVSSGGAGGGGGSFVWDNASTTYPLISAGGGGGAGKTTNGVAGAITYTLTTLATAGTPGSGGNGGLAGSAGKPGIGGGGGGWNSQGTLATRTANNAQGGFGIAGAFSGGLGATGSGGSKGGYGGGGGGGYNASSIYGAGGGGGGYNGGGGGNVSSNTNQKGGQGGSTGYYNGATFTTPISVVKQTNNANGTVTIYY